MCAALLSAAALVPAPPAALPLLVVVGIGAPMLVACELPRAVAALRRPRTPALDARALQAMHRQIDALPETNHPLGY